MAPRVFVAWKSVSGGAIKEFNMQEEIRPSPFDAMADELEQLEADSRNLDFRKAVLKASEELTPEERAEFEKNREAILKDATSMDRANSRTRQSLAPLRNIVRPKKDSFWNDEEQDTDVVWDQESGEDTFNEDDITSMAHGKLEEHREHREYARIAIWEMPLLSSKLLWRYYRALRK